MVGHVRSSGCRAQPPHLRNGQVLQGSVSVSDAPSDLSRFCTGWRWQIVEREPNVVATRRGTHATLTISLILSGASLPRGAGPPVPAIPGRGGW